VGENVAVNFDIECLATFSDPEKFDLFIPPDAYSFTSHLS